MIKLPLYRCTKFVNAAKIVGLIDHLTKRLLLDGGEEIEISNKWINKHNPKIGGYYVVYKDGYSSYSPPQPFEEGYVKTNNPETEIEAGVKKHSLISVYNPNHDELPFHTTVGQFREIVKDIVIEELDKAFDLSGI